MEENFKSVNYLIPTSLWTCNINGASSPPIAIIPPTPNQPTIKSLLEESLEMLDEASKTAETGKHCPNCKESIQVQMALLAVELRMESRTKSILNESSVDSNDVTEFDEILKQNRQQKNQAFMSNIVYSPEALKRVLLLITKQSSIRKLTLSRKRTINFDQPQKVLCSYCSMQCFNTDLKCEYCAIGKVFVWYCTEECQLDHAKQHQCQCLKNKNEKGIDFRSFLNVLTPTS
jgi:hypothetical protein